MGMWLAICNQMSGINVVNVYAPTIFDQIKKDNPGSGGFTTEQDTYFIGAAGFLGAVLSNFTVALFSRRKLFIGGHMLMGVFLSLIAIGVNIGQPTLILSCIVAFIISLQTSNGTCFWVYCGETVTPVGLGLCLFMLMGYLTIVIFIAPMLVTGSFGVANTFFLLAGFQVITCVTLFLWLRETTGLTA